MLTAEHVDLRRLSGRIGAQVFGVHLGPDLTGETVERIRQAVLRYKVVFFRGQDSLDDCSQDAFTSLLGRSSPQHPIAPPGEEVGGMFILDSSYIRANLWHTDSSYIADYPAFPS